LVSCICTLYVLPEAKRAAFLDAKRGEKVVTRKRGWLRDKVTVSGGDKFLWEWLDAEASRKAGEVPCAGLALADYLFEYPRWPVDSAADLAAGAVDDDYHALGYNLARRLQAFLRAHPPEREELLDFAAEHRDADGAYADALREAHFLLLEWFGRLQRDEFLVLRFAG
jgi:hypothetical protein